MKKTLLLLFAFLLSASTAYSTTVAFVDVNVIPMDKERVLSHQTFGVQPLGCSVREKAS